MCFTFHSHFYFDFFSLLHMHRMYHRLGLFDGVLRALAQRFERMSDSVLIFFRLN